MSKTKYPLVEITWLDAMSKSGWHYVDDAENFQPPECKTIGYLLFQDASRIVVGGTLNEGEDETADMSVIPVGMFVSMREI